MVSLNDILVEAKALRETGDALVNEFRETGLSIEAILAKLLEVTNFLGASLALLDKIADAGIDTSESVELRDHLQRIAFIQQDFEAVIARAETYTKPKLH